MSFLEDENLEEFVRDRVAARFCINVALILHQCSINSAYMQNAESMLHWCINDAESMQNQCCIDWEQILH